MTASAQRVRQARDLLGQVHQQLAEGGSRDPSMEEVVSILTELPGLLRATAGLLDQVDPAVAAVVLNSASSPGWLHSPAERARYVASALRSKADDVVGITAKLRLAR
ncbi:MULTISPECIES: hypothetical protein [unclassified Crossiella]|uniref:hypothetical protein n=1 Tax=unclassified Crossiella TaxID=2620835 RepID=UPI001FFF8E4C|nr:MULTISPECIES: hypothetical protein [unclassified Crossiella]MCK2242505.1 hypothetical protein [Crossiella sp. S99.2]MCK2254465.1 hypothetical protein [Crossiella sp. S99.1]